MLLLSETDVRKALLAVDPVAVVREGVRLHGEGRCTVARESAMHWRTRSGAHARSLALPGRLELDDPQQGVKIINAGSSNRRRGLPRASGVTCLFDEESARIVCLASAGVLSALRTACVSMIAVELLARKPIQRLCVLGAGVLARAHLEVMLPRMPGLREITIFDIQPDATIALRGCACALAPQTRYTPSRTAEQAVRGADVVIAVTTATDGYVEWEWIASGSLIINVSLADLKREVFLRAERLFVDDWELVSADRTRELGRLIAQGAVIGPAAEAVPGARRVAGELSAVVTGRTSGRNRAEDRVLVNPFGCGTFDIALLAAVHRVARREHLGQGVEFE
jgi:ornithine cyclodeaminase/alanine dehydrogenase-like protein (mu-crystallin family)